MFFNYFYLIVKYLKCITHGGEGGQIEEDGPS